MCVWACACVRVSESAREKEREFPLKALATFERLQPNKRFEIQNDKSSELKICQKHKIHGRKMPQSPGSSANKWLADRYSYRKWPL